MGHGSLVPYFAESYRKKTGRDVICVHVAKGATTISQWLKTNSDGENRYKKLVGKVTECKKATSETIGRVLFVWLQGESDALAKTSESDYFAMLSELKSDLEKDIGIDRFMIIEVGYFASNFGGKEYDEAIMRAQESAAEKGFVMLTDITRRLSLDSNYINPEAVGHFNNEAMRIIGTVAGEAAGKAALEISSDKVSAEV